MAEKVEMPAGAPSLGGGGPRNTCKGDPQSDGVRRAFQGALSSLEEQQVVIDRQMNHSLTMRWGEGGQRWNPPCPQLMMNSGKEPSRCLILQQQLLLTLQASAECLLMSSRFPIREISLTSSPQPTPLEMRAGGFSIIGRGLLSNQSQVCSLA